MTQAPRLTRRSLLVALPSALLPLPALAEPCLPQPPLGRYRYAIDVEGHGTVGSMTVNLAQTGEVIEALAEAIADEGTAWQNRPLEPCYPVVLMDTSGVNIHSDGAVSTKTWVLKQQGRRDVPRAAAPPRKGESAGRSRGRGCA
ncbi:MAG: transposase [Rhodospirillales bacterium]|nr:transposase [Rhodospirillales bacterium]